MDMVEKTRRSLTVLRRCQEADREELNYWIRRYSDAEDLKKTSSSSSSQSRQQSPASQETNALGNTFSAQDIFIIWKYYVLFCASICVFKPHILYLMLKRTDLQ